MVNEYPTRKATTIRFGTFTFSNPYCKLLKYTVEGDDAKEVTISGTSSLTYKTDYNEPRTLKFNLRVHAQGDGINGYKRS